MPTTKSPQRHRTLFALWILIAVTLLACGPGPKPPQLLNIEHNRKGTEFAQIRQLAPASAKLHDVAYKRAIEAWQDGEDDEVLEFTAISQIHYDAAELQYRKKEEQQRAMNATSQIKDLTVRIESMKGKLQLAEEQLAGLESENDKKNFAQSTGGKAAVALRAAEGEKAKADGMRAVEFSAGAYAQAENTMKLARDHIDAQRFEEGLKAAEEAQKLYIAAITEARPRFEAEAQLVKLFADAQRDFASDAFQDGRGVGVVVSRLFKKKKSKIRKDKEFMLEIAVKLAIKYPQTNIIIEGHTQSSGSDSKNQTISEKRAEVVRKFFISEGGIDDLRLSTVGHGEEQVRFDEEEKDERGKNDRVEIFFVVPRQVKKAP